MVTDDQQAPPFELTAPGGAEIDDSMSSATIHRLFADPLPHEVVRLGDSGRRYITRHGWMTEAAARERIEQWKLHARAQAEGGANGNKVVLSLFDHTGNWSQPWEDAGYQVLRFDIQNDRIWATCLLLVSIFLSIGLAISMAWMFLRSWLLAHARSSLSAERGILRPRMLTDEPQQPSSLCIRPCAQSNIIVRRSGQLKTLWGALESWLDCRRGGCRSTHAN